MTHKVSDDQYGKLRRRLDEVARRVDQGTILFNPVMSALTLIIEGEFPRPHFKRNMSKEKGWTLESDVGFNPVISSVDDLERVKFLNYDEHSILCAELEKRAKKMKANFGQQHAEWLLEHQNQIPESWRGTYIVFPGTVWHDSGSDSRLPYLLWYGGRWCLHFRWLGGRVSSGGRVVRLSK